MEYAQNYVLSPDGVILRCKFVKGSPIPLEIVDMVEILETLKMLLLNNKTVERKRCSSDPGPKPSKLKPFQAFRNRIMSDVSDSKRHIATVIEADKPASLLLRMSPAMQLRRNKNSFKNKIKSLSDELNCCENISECLNEKPSEYVHICTFDRLEHTEEFLQRLINLKLTFSIEIDVDIDEKISISYQKLKNFESEYMVLNTNNGGCFMLMRPF